MVDRNLRFYPQSHFMIRSPPGMFAALDEFAAAPMLWRAIMSLLVGGDDI
jgi:hypothetical protein